MQRVVRKKLTLIVSKSIATLGFFGYLPAPGTMGTIVTLPLAYGLSFLTLPHQAAVILIASCVSYFVIKGALQSFTTSDPSQIILDELIGTLVTFYGIQYNPTNFVVGFILFRLFDIFKPLGIKYLEKLPGAWGVLLDDVAAGVFANLILRLFFV